jgi:hypothetical protein
MLIWIGLIVLAVSYPQTPGLIIGCLLVVCGVLLAIFDKDVD